MLIKNQFITIIIIIDENNIKSVYLATLVTSRDDAAHLYIPPWGKRVAPTRRTREPGPTQIRNRPAIYLTLKT